MKDDDQRPDLTALLGSRICHDLISPLGAIGNGLELLGMSQNKTSPEMELISESVQSATARIRFFRIAFGASTKGQIINRAEMATILADSFDPRRITLAHDLCSAMPRHEVKLAALLLLCLETALPRGGHMTVQSTAKSWHLTAGGPRLSVDSPFWRDPAVPLMTDVAASEIHFALVSEAAERAERRPQVSIEDSGIDIRF
ncbi:histidine phosphotransferase family protein [Actibacterium lipolyticum]|uniref:Histidine phosphotransferase ChpT C-terminal domain-containing protein n=1 Tax=Actibacterium lipolyticum TaxID=1524263 RepID=A0A238JZV5_9RHOB|nr:histidine phosphotransferase family protein [Actibacterium lipolyticum]SMX35236.1 hypothetical protein COL8621_01717 [Actibacterium lipolyticum]